MVLVAFTAMWVLTVLTAFASVTLCFGRFAAERLFGQEEDVAVLVGQYCLGLIPGMWPLVLGLVLIKYLQVNPASYICILHKCLISAHNDSCYCFVRALIRSKI